ncbi:hypothetical protein ACFVOR_06395 [Streptomyces sp. NPDC057837]|uniref:hypothetical protein n=1 Tax=Streptomyces sp. NPDC057837 TaxID=3346260 RepID=UPI00368DBE76
MTITTPDDFTRRWRQPPNFPLNISFGYTFLPAIDVLDHIRKDEEVRFTILGDDDCQVRMDRTAAFRTAPLEEVVTWPFRLVHLNLSRFYDDVLSGFQEEVMIPWRTHLSARRRVIDLPQ